MSLKKTIPLALIGLALEGGVLVLAHRMGWINLRRLDWRNWLVWALFFAGFFSAYWLVLWFKFINKCLSFKNKQTSAPSTPTTSQPVSSVARVGQPPARMTVQNSAVLSVGTQQAQPGQAPVNSAAPASMAPVPVPLTPSTPASTKQQDILDLAKVGTDLDMMAFKHVALDGKVIDIIYSSDDIAVLCKVLSTEHHWTVDTTQPIESCTWKDETGATQNPCVEVLSQAAILERMESGATIIPTFVLMRGSIENAAEVSAYLNHNHIRLVKYNLDSADGIQDLYPLLKEKFALIPDEEDNEDEEENEDNTEEQGQEQPTNPLPSEQT